MMSSRSLLTTALLFSMVFLLGSPRVAHAQADLIIATNAAVTYPTCTEELSYFYFFTVVDDGGGISTPVITNLAYASTAPTRIDVYDDGEFTYATFEFQVTIPSPALGASVSDCFTITYEGESVNPCFDVVKPPREVCSIETQSVSACVHKETGLMRLVQAEDSCRPQESRIELALATQDTATAARSAAPAPARREQ